MEALPNRHSSLSLATTRGLHCRGRRRDPVLLERKTKAYLENRILRFAQGECLFLPWFKPHGCSSRSPRSSDGFRKMTECSKFDGLNGIGLSAKAVRTMRGPNVEEEDRNRPARRCEREEGAGAKTPRSAASNPCTIKGRLKIVTGK